MRLGISSWTFPWSVGLPGRELPEGQRMNAFDLLQWAHEAGLAVVQLADNLPPLHAEETAALAKLADSFAIDLELGTRGLEPANLQMHLHRAGILHCKLIRTLLPSPLEEAWCMTIAQVKAILPAFEQSGIVLAVENYEAQSSASLLKLVNHFDNEFLKICLDTTNSLGALETPDETVNRLAPVAANLHIKDFAVERLPEKIGFVIGGRPAGHGMLDIPCILNRMHACNPGISVILEQWPPFTSSLEETVRMERDWAVQGIAYLGSVLHGR